VRSDERYCAICRHNHRFFPLSYTVPHAGKLLGVGRTQAYEMASRGDIPVISASGRTALVPKEKFHEQYGGRHDEHC
jgi:excisionase family DNA binding protein